jgi:hypothetical protein
MSSSHLSKCLMLLLAAGSLSTTGCFGFTLFGPNMGPFNSIAGVPIPVSPYFQKKPEDRFHMQERYNRVPILGPLTEGGPVTALDPPSDDEVMRALEEIHPTQGGIPLIHEVQRNDVRIVKEPIADYIDPPRVYPLIGPAQLHHAHYKCTVYYRETTRVGWPLPHTLEDEDSREVIYIDHNHFHRCGGDDGTLPAGDPME